MTWIALRHPNVLPLSGATMGEINLQWCLWVANGNINEFIKTRRDAYLLVGLSSLSTAPTADIPFSQLKVVARGLIYMRSNNDTWGSKGGNGHARLADSGFLTIASDPIHPTASSSSAKGGTTRWMSPELLGPDQFGFNDSRPTKESDCYALGMVIYGVRAAKSPTAQEFYCRAEGHRG